MIPRICKRKGYMRGTNYKCSQSWFWLNPWTLMKESLTNANCLRFLIASFSFFNAGVNMTQVCCIKDLNAKSNITTEQESPLQADDISIMYDVLNAYETNYWVPVTISNDNPISKLDNWRLTWEWMRNEFIYTMWGAHPSILDTKECLFGAQGEYYKELDFSIALNCERRPTIADMPLDRTNNTNLGMIPFCCCNGTLLPPTLDPMKSKSAFQMQVYKMEPDLNRNRLNPPMNWMINGTSSPEYHCGQPVRVRSSLLPNPQGLTSEVAAVPSWQIVCNISRHNPQWRSQTVAHRFHHSMILSFHATLVPVVCNLNPSNMCNTTAPALLLPP